MQFRWRIAQFFELIWWRLYLLKKPKKDYLHWKKAYWDQFLKTTKVIVFSGAQVLDAGCGPAGIFTILNHCSVDAIDPLLDKYVKYLDHFSPTDYPYVRFLNQTLEAFPTDKKYDLVFALNAINHVEDLGSSMDRLQQLTKKGGQLILSVDAHNYQVLQQLFSLIPGDILHPHQYKLEDYKMQLSQRGFTEISCVRLQKNLIFNYYLMVYSH